MPTSVLGTLVHSATKSASSAPPESSKARPSQISWQNGRTSSAVKYARTVLSCPETRHQMAGSCTSTAHSHDKAREAAAVLILPTQDKLYYVVQLCFQRGEKVSNNIAEYEVLIAGLKVAAALGVKRLIMKGDS